MKELSSHTKVDPKISCDNLVAIFARQRLLAVGWYRAKRWKEKRTHTEENPTENIKGSSEMHKSFCLIAYQIEDLKS